MATTNFDDSAASSALTSMSSAALDLYNNAKNYATALENDVFANLSGSSVQKFIAQSQVHCENLANIVKDINAIVSDLNNIKTYHADQDTRVSRV